MRYRAHVAITPIDTIEYEPFVIEGYVEPLTMDGPVAVLFTANGSEPVEEPAEAPTVDIEQHIDDLLPTPIDVQTEHIDPPEPVAEVEEEKSPLGAAVDLIRDFCNQFQGHIPEELALRAFAAVDASDRAQERPSRQFNVVLRKEEDKVAVKADTMTLTDNLLRLRNGKRTVFATELFNVQYVEEVIDENAP